VDLSALLDFGGFDFGVKNQPFVGDHACLGDFIVLSQLGLVSLWTMVNYSFFRVPFDVQVCELFLIVLLVSFTTFLKPFTNIVGLLTSVG
jgi:hypothetical protein